MIADRRHIRIGAAPEAVFDLIATMPNKFPVYRVLETKPFFFLRILLVDGLRSAVAALRIEKPDDTLVLNIGESMGPFRLTVCERPRQYWFDLASFFFDCRTGYTLARAEGGTLLCFDLVSPNPHFLQRLWWFFVKPFHGLFAGKVLKVIKQRAEKMRPQMAGTSKGSASLVPGSND